MKDLYKNVNRLPTVNDSFPSDQYVFIRERSFDDKVFFQFVLIFDCWLADKQKSSFTILI